MTFNRERGEWPLYIEDRVYKLRLTTYAQMEVEGSDFIHFAAWDEVMAALGQGKVTACVVLLWASLRQYHPEIATPDAEGLRAVSDLVDQAGGFDEIMVQIVKFAESNAKPQDPHAAADPLRAAGGTGPPSTRARLQPV